MAPGRTLEQVSTEIAREREQLANAVTQLRGELKQAADVRAILRAQGPKLAIGAAVLVAGVVARTMLSRRRAASEPRGREWLSLGRFVIVERE